ncbi:ParA family protein [Sphingomonas sp. S1-29]|uniref:ParA family protein n=1 Tax=Sphingomonas qomolangmaensis TaxID=2918765 RepID=A0ABY5L9R1_9SPHN|nr:MULTISPECIES: ParA family protein [Sphingomonas]UUL82881.1 ParA family protein [Sphingomonas qomolangmaensis]UZK69366.1 ParA family protein [Sphingomonas sp. S1-29]
MAVVAVYSLKGGVGKTTLAVNLAWCAAQLSARRTLLWDLDPQAASTFLLGRDQRAADSAQAIFTKDVEPTRLVRPTGIDRLDLIGADTSLRSLDVVFHSLDKKKRLAKLVGSLDSAYDRLILDCPPGLTETSEQVMRAADLIIVPIIPSPLATRAFEEVVQHLDRKGGKVPLLPVHAMVDKRRKLHADRLALHPDWPVIPMASMVETMAARRLPVGAFAPKSAAQAAFAGLWQAVERRLSAAR